MSSRELMTDDTYMAIFTLSEQKSQNLERSCLSLISPFKVSVCWVRWDFIYEHLCYSSCHQAMEEFVRSQYGLKLIKSLIKHSRGQHSTSRCLYYFKILDPKVFILLLGIVADKERSLDYWTSMTSSPWVKNRHLDLDMLPATIKPMMLRASVV